MEKKHRCKLCLRNFANGRALGGHMRSHMMKFYAEEIEHDFQSSSSSSSASSSEEEEEDERERGLSSYVLRENPKKSAIMADHDFSSVVVQDGESETESCRRRSKRVRSDLDVLEVKKAKVFENEQSSPLSSISDTTPEEHVAHCLIMLSRDTWHKVEMKKNKFRGKYRCEECNKLFRSYQALGGHRASHKKIKLAPPPRTPPDNKIHQCPFCHRIFSSGQALGGHKRSHFIGSATSSTISQVLSIDLNLPAPLDDDEGSQIAISAVSDAEFVKQ